MPFRTPSGYLQGYVRPFQTGGGSLRRQPTFEELFAAQPRSEQLRLSGAPDIDVESARQFERLYGPTGIATTVGAQGAHGSRFFETEEVPPRAGLLEILGDYATRLQSGTTGFVTGLMGLERRRQTRDARGIADGQLFDSPEAVQGGWALARERAGQGFRGEEKFQAADFGALAYDRDEAGTGERFMKSAAGFVLDVALDPLTYISFGASILGRRAGAVAVNAQARRNASLVTKTLDSDAQQALIRDAVRRSGTDEAVITASLRDQIAGPLTRTADGILSLDDALALAAANSNVLESVAIDSLAYMSAGMYRSFGAGGLRSYLKKSFGDVGMDLWSTLPADLRGGVRIRVPFSGFFRRTQTGAPSPLAIPLSPFKPGVVGDFTNLSGLSNWTRDAFRSKMLLRGGSNKASGLTGATDAATASAIYRKEADTAGRLFGRKTAEVDPSLRATSWASANATAEEMAAFRKGLLSAHAKLYEPVTQARVAYRAGRDLAADEFDRHFDTLIQRNLADFDGAEVSTVEAALGIAGRAPTEVEAEAYRAAFNFQVALKRVEAELSDLENRSPGFSVNFLENYWPRIIDNMEEELRGKGYGAGSFANLRNRTHYVAEFNSDGSVKSWMTPRAIAEQLGRAKFVEDADVAMSAYLVSMDKFIQEERLFQNLFQRGVLFRAGEEAFNVSPNLTAASSAWLSTWNDVSSRAARLTAEGVTEATPRVSSAQLSGAALDSAAARATRIGQAIQGGRVHGPRLIGNYEPVATGGAAVWRSPDGITISQLDNGTYSISRFKDGDTEWLLPSSRWSKTQPTESFLTFDDARSVADRNMATFRKRQFVRQMEDLREEFFLNHTAMLRTQNNLSDMGLNPLHPGNVPMEHQNEFFDMLVENINRFGSAAGLRDREVIASAYRDAAWGAGRGQAFAPVSGRNGPAMRQYWSNRMEQLGVFGPETVVEDVRNIYRAMSEPTTFQNFVNNFYRPFYAWQKALMTSQRGPGYVARNIQGGMWNAYLLGTSARHFRIAGSVKTAEAQARFRAKRAFPDESDIRKRAERAQEEFQKILKERFGDKRGAELNDIWISFEERGLRGREISSRTPGTQAVAQASGELSGDLGRLIPDADQNIMQRAAEWGTSHWWARTMGDMAQGSEDYLRFAAFLRGVDVYGLEDGGRAAGLIVKASQFDYADLSRFEAETLKMLIPFYTWTRNNVPLQFRAMISEPGKVMKAIRLNDALADAFGEPDDPGEPLPAYVRERFGWRVRKDIIMGPEGDAISAGMVFGEPLVDINRLFGTPTRPGGWGLGTILNWREVANNINPLFTAGAPALTAMELSTGGRLPREEEAPPWAVALGLSRVTPEGDRVASSRVLRGVRDFVTPIGMAERYAPQLLGNERMQRRWYTSMASAILGLPVSTLDPFQTTAELRQQEARLQGSLQRELGEGYTERVGYVREALQIGATPQELEFIKRNLLGGRNVSEVPVEELDVFRMRDTVYFMRRIDNLRARGVPDETLRIMADYFNPRTDASEGARAGAAQPLTEEELAELGETPQSVARMTDEERAELVARYAAQNPDWRPRRR